MYICLYMYFKKYENLFQGAALSVAQYLTATSQLEVDDSESSESESDNEQVPPVRPQAEVPSNINRNKPKKVRSAEQRNHPEPQEEVNPVVTQLMEMGFPKKNVKFALKAISEMFFIYFDNQEFIEFGFYFLYVYVDIWYLIMWDFVLYNSPQLIFTL